MKKCVFIGICLLLFSTVAEAETMYVSEIKITMRLGPGNNRKILSMLSTGQPVEILEKGQGWTNIRLEDGKKGWVLSRYLTSQRPPVFASEALIKRCDSLSLHVTSLEEENSRLKEEIERLTSGFSDDEKAFDELSKSYEKLKIGCSDFLEVETAYKKAAFQLAEQRKKNAKTEAELKEIRKDQRLWWVLSGAGVLLLGIVLGAVGRGQSRRSSLI
ncbi:TIGR04211 family SH3 domain-containing protein [Desulfonema magnum]|uniref:SH3 domain-contaning protein n=1 Tax=Desulfonema magnum TaxID=45655 RepID=A0A975BF31_9BACT|nr:TIGR04211 family SH3 domain-containing protein [Desulfonema magnum]QTA84227.1 SH3 domain-contaning protein [Desulfonema magnum]